MGDAIASCNHLQSALHGEHRISTCFVGFRNESVPRANQAAKYFF